MSPYRRRWRRRGVVGLVALLVGIGAWWWLRDRAARLVEQVRANLAAAAVEPLEPQVTPDVIAFLEGRWQPPPEQLYRYLSWYLGGQPKPDQNLIFRAKDTSSRGSRT